MDGITINIWIAQNIIQTISNLCYLAGFLWMQTANYVLIITGTVVLAITGTAIATYIAYAKAHELAQKLKAQRILQESEAKYKSLFETSLEGIAVSKGNRIISVNQAALDIFGYSSLEEFTRIPFLDHVASESREMIITRLKKRQKAELLEPLYEYKIIRKDGEIRNV